MTGVQTCALPICFPVTIQSPTGWLNVGRGDGSAPYAGAVSSFNSGGTEIGKIDATTGNLFLTASNIQFRTPNTSVVFDSNNRVGIGTGSPGFPLHVTNTANCNSTYRYFDSNTTGLGLVTTTLGFGIYCDGRILSTLGFFANSDMRMKKHLLDISDGEALQQLRRIEPTSYEYIDTIEKGSNRVYGFIAQQIKDVLPHAVTLSQQSVPDIYDIADISGINMYLRNKTFDFTDASANVEVISRNSGKLDISASFYPPNTITLHTPFQQDMSDIFVYGRKVNDFHVLDKNAIFTVNVAATQELDRQLQAARMEISLLKDTLSNVVTRLQALETT